MFRNVLGDTVEKSSGCSILLLLLLPFAIWQVSQDEKKEEKENAEYQKQSCRIERSISEEESIARCENAAALFNKDISADPRELAICVEQRESTLKRCDKMGL